LIIGQFLILNSNGAAQQPAPSATLYSEQFRLEQNNIRYYVTALNASQVWEINLTSVYHGIFHLFLFDSRPQKEYLGENGALDSSVYTDSVAYNNTPVVIPSKTIENDTINFVSLSYTASNDSLYYLMVALVGGTAPDTFILTSNSQVQAYFIPFLPGYPLEWIIVSSMLGFGVVIIKKRIFKMN
jgi:hypothetical protein